MTTTNLPKWFNRGVTFSLAAAAAASAVFWVLQWQTARPVPRATVSLNASEAIDPRKVAQLLGDRATAAPDAAQNNTVVNNRFKLLGVIATGRRNGSALIATDTLPAKPYRIGDRVSDTLVLKSVSVRSVVLADGVDAPDGITLTLPDPPGLN